MATAQYFSIISWPFNNPENPAYVPVIWTANTDSMTFWQRVTNTVQAMAYYWLHMRTLDKEQAILNQNLDEKYRKRSLREIYFDSAKDSFMFSFDSRITGYARPMQRKLVEVGPLHLVDPKPLDESLQKWMDGAPEGVIYFSLGTNMKGTSMGDFRRKAFLKAFARLPQYRVLWKWENDVMEGLGENIRLQKWMPQQDILGRKF
ncbi:UDP-glucuronosyltransferase 2B10 [Diaphorina citri]|uniref:UDP-glucuronosyltransferase 2B10 n=1 Tax=Diaphorina citri TaxID=121845 RepID=A0A3Q0JEP8_DIACI|nr:UDP-glucuronosyltransferase 2B10 [Diaphorina citri]